MYLSMKCLKQASCTAEQDASSHNSINTLHDSSNKTGYWPSHRGKAVEEHSPDSKMLTVHVAHHLIGLHFHY